MNYDAKNVNDSMHGSWAMVGTDGQTDGRMRPMLRFGKVREKTTKSQGKVSEKSVNFIFKNLWEPWRPGCGRMELVAADLACSISSQIVVQVQSFIKSLMFLMKMGAIGHGGLQLRGGTCLQLQLYVPGGVTLHSGT